MLKVKDRPQKRSFIFEKMFVLGKAALTQRALARDVIKFEQLGVHSLANLFFGDLTRCYVWSCN